MKKTIAVIGLAFALALAGCSSNPKITVQQSKITVPDELQSCADSPTKPTGDYTQRRVAKYVVKLNAAHKDCEKDLRSLNEVVRANSSKK